MFQTIFVWLSIQGCFLVYFSSHFQYSYNSKENIWNSNYNSENTIVLSKLTFTLVIPLNYILFNLFINWRKIVRQFCVNFCHATTQICHNYTYNLSLELPSTLPRSSQSIRLSSLCYEETSQQLSTLHMIVYIC